MGRPVNYLFCQYRVFHEGTKLSSEAEFTLISENQGTEHDHGREKNGIRPATLCTKPTRLDYDGRRVHTFNIGFKPGYRVKQEYNRGTEAVDSTIETDTHTKFGHIVSLPELGVMAVRDKGGDGTIVADQTIRAFRSLVAGILGEDSELNVVYATDEDVEQALRTWELNEYSFTARPINPTAGALAKMRSEMYNSENVGKETGKVVAAEGQALKMADGTLGQTHDMHEHGYAQIGFKGYTQDGRKASIPKPPFKYDKQKNLEIRDVKPRYIRVAFDPEDNIVNSISGALVAFYER